MEYKYVGRRCNVIKRFTLRALWSSQTSPRIGAINNATKASTQQLHLFLLLCLAHNPSQMPSTSTDTHSTHLFRGRASSPDLTVNILFPILSLVLAVITIIQAAYLARAYFRRTISTQANQDVELEPQTNGLRSPNLSDPSIQDDALSLNEIPSSAPAAST